MLDFKMFHVTALVLCLLLTGSFADPIQDLAKQASAARCPYSDYDSSKFCPNVQGEIESASNNAMVAGIAGVGIDITTGQVMLPLYGMIPSHRNYTSPSGKTYTIPEFVDFAKGDMSPKLAVHVFKELEEYLAMWNIPSPSTPSISRLGGLFGHTRTATDILRQYFTASNTHSAGATQSFHTAYTMTLNATAPLDPHFRQAIAYAEQNPTAQVFSQIMKYWGTHSVVSADFGGIVEQQVGLMTCLWTSQANLNSDLIAKQMNMDFNHLLNPASPAANNQDFVNSRVQGGIGLRGGNPTISNVPQRVATFADFPVISQIRKGVMLSSLIPTAFPKAKAGLQAAITQHMAAASQAMVADKTAARAAADAKWKEGLLINSGEIIFVDGPDGAADMLDIEQSTHLKGGESFKFVYVECQRDAATGAVRAFTGDTPEGRGPWKTCGCSEIHSKGTGQWATLNYELRCCIGCAFTVTDDRPHCNPTGPGMKPPFSCKQFSCPCKWSDEV
eukprot:TRINITY_DN24776_c0_g1_i1.p1 TRINITY_DN24776_c0_g1~~TRINITY_DN24776_c0_g1_i1.p1  ORF type:complete len:503 (-),score=118.46 TRINITY_DN24776_c0_g1_i1:69-1577(-)